MRTNILSYFRPNKSALVKQPPVPPDPVSPPPFTPTHELPVSLPAVESGVFASLDSSPGDDTDDYEAVRVMNMKRNAEFLRQLGLHDVKLAMGQVASAATAPKPSKKRKIARSPPVPTRRSTRNSSNPVRYGLEDTVDQTISHDESESDEDAEGDYQDSSVLRYVMETRRVGDTSMTVPHNEEGVENEPLSWRLSYNSIGVAESGMNCSDLSAVYSMHMSASHPDLILAAGKKGHVALFANRKEDYQSGAPDMTSGESSDKCCLMDFKAHEKWIGSAKFVTSLCGLGVATCSDDGSIKIWDISSVKVNNKSSKNPKLLTSSVTAHSRGIYGMDVGGTNILTCSKDSYIVHSSITKDADLRVVSSFDLHKSVVKSVAWKHPCTVDEVECNTFASGGSDNVLCIKDIRCGNKNYPDLSANDLFGSGGIHTVQWSPEPSHGNILLAAGFTDVIKLFDIRKLSCPVLELKGHCSGKITKSSAIITPTFVTGKNAVATAGYGNSKITVFCASTGKCLSSGELCDQPISAYSPPYGGSLNDTSVLVSCRNKGSILPLCVTYAPISKIINVS
jgi:hypothetical protein